MAVDFSGLVLGPLVTIFGEGEDGVTFTPLASQPGEAAYDGNGVFSRKAVELQTEQGYVSDVRPVLGIRLADFAVAPQQGDRVTIKKTGITFGVFDVQPDGEGGADLILVRA